MNTIRQHFEQAHRLLEQVMNDEVFLRSVQKAGEAMSLAINQGFKIVSCGNGGSMCVAAISISDPSHMSCVGNDYGYQFVFSRFVEGVGHKGDVLLAISTSGNSANVVEAVKAARAKGMLVVALTGKDGGQLAQCCDVEVRVPWMEYADRIQEIHIKVIHVLIDFIERHRVV
jgi:D-sedoheptulose 7-phosphate isomerase